MNKYLETLNSFRDFLIKSGYPKDTIVTELTIGELAKHKIDLAIVDPTDNTAV